MSASSSARPALPDKDLHTKFAGNHASALPALWHGQIDAAAWSERGLRSMAKSGVIESCGFPDQEIGRAQSAAEIKAVFDACPTRTLAPLHYSFLIPGTPIALRADPTAALKLPRLDA